MITRSKYTHTHTYCVYYEANNIDHARPMHHTSRYAEMGRAALLFTSRITLFSVYITCVESCHGERARARDV